MESSYVMNKCPQALFTGFCTQLVGSTTLFGVQVLQVQPRKATSFAHFFKDHLPLLCLTAMYCVGQLYCVGHLCGDQ